MTGQMISLYSADTGESMVAFKPKVYKGKNNTEKVRDSQECFAQVLLVFVHAFNIYMWFKGKLYIISSERVRVCPCLVCIVTETLAIISSGLTFLLEMSYDFSCEHLSKSEK